MNYYKMEQFGTTTIDYRAPYVLQREDGSRVVRYTDNGLTFEHEFDNQKELEKFLNDEADYFKRLPRAEFYN